MPKQDKPTEIVYLQGDATEPIGDGHRYIVHSCNDRGGWKKTGDAFTAALSRKGDVAEHLYRSWYRGDLGHSFELGTAQICPVAEKLWVVNIIAQAGYKSKANPRPFQPEAFRRGLQRLQTVLPDDASVHMPLVGTGLGGDEDTWPVTEQIIKEELCAYGWPVAVYVRM